MDAQNGGVTTQTADNIVNVGTAGVVNIVQKTQNKPFNQYLTKVLISAIKPYSDDAAKFLDEYSGQPDWNQVSAISSEAQDYIISCYVNMIGSQLMKLIAIGVEKYSEDQQKRYIDKCIVTAKTTLQILCAALLSDVWTLKGTNDFALLPEEADTLKSYFEYSRQLDWDISLFVNLFKVLMNMYTRMSLTLPITDLAGFNDQLKTDGDLSKMCDVLCGIQNAKDVDKYTDKNCDLAEKNLADFLVAFGFLASYKMVSIKSVSYEEVRNTTPHYLHSYVELGAKNTATNTATGIKYVSDPVSTDSILLFKGNYMKTGINLFPFILDYNALNITGGVKICFYSSIDVNKVKSDDDDDDDAGKTVNIMRFYFPEDDTKQTISFAGLLTPDANITKLLKDDQSRIQLKKDTVFLQFWDAKKTILGAK